MFTQNDLKKRKKVKSHSLRSNGITKKNEFFHFSLGIGIPKYLNIHKSLNKCEVTVKSTLTKRTIRGEKVVEKKKQQQQQHQKRQNWRERGRERELTFFVVNNLEGIGERGGNEVKEIYKKIKLEEEE